MFRYIFVPRWGLFIFGVLWLPSIILASASATAVASADLAGALNMAVKWQAELKAIAKAVQTIKVKGILFPSNFVSFIVNLYCKFVSKWLSVWKGAKTKRDENLRMWV